MNGFSPSGAAGCERSRITWLSDALNLFSRRIAGKIIIPYLVLVLLLAVLATYVTVNLTAASLEEKFQDELISAGRSANEAMVGLEDQQLAILRQMLFTVGVDDAVAGRDAEALQALLAPIAANHRILYVDVFTLDGRELLALRSPEIGPDAVERIDPNAARWPPIQAVLAGKVDDMGDKHASILLSPWELLVTAGPVKRGDEILGTVAVALPIAEVTARLSQEAGSKGMTLYTLDGRLVSSTIRSTPAMLAERLRIPAAQSDEVLRANRVIVRRATPVDLPYVEALGVLAVRREPTMIMGVGNLVTIIDERGGWLRNVMLALFIAAALVAIAVGLLAARRISRPVQTLVQATDRIRRNELEFELPVQTRDETGALTVAFNEMTGGLREREKSRVAIEKYMSPKVYQLIQSKEMEMGGASREITVVKTDIRGFTSIAEHMEPTNLISYLNRYFERMVAPITKYDGEVDKYMGDAVLAKFGATEWYPDHARRAVLAMIEMIEACEALSEELRREGLPPIKMGIGANTGEAIVGNLGSTERMEYTIISDAVNAAQRIEELCKEFGWDLLISEETYGQAQDAVDVGRPWSIVLRGQTRPTLVYPLLGRKGAVTPERVAGYQALEAAGQAAPRGLGAASSGND